MFKGISQCIPLWVFFTMVFSIPSITLPYPFTFHPHFSTAFNIHPISSSFTDFMFYNIIDALSSSFPFPHSLSSIEKFHYYKHVLYMNFYMMMLVFVYMFIFCIPLLCMRENMWPLSSEPGLPFLNMMYSNCIHLPSHCHSSLWLSKTPLCIYTSFSLSIQHDKIFKTSKKLRQVMETLTHRQIPWRYL
jgi:hypothetical protein